MENRGKGEKNSKNMQCHKLSGILQSKRGNEDNETGVLKCGVMI